MKKSLFLVMMLSIGFASFANRLNDAVIMSIDGKPIMKSEFEYIYFKNNERDTVSKSALLEYMELYKKFKLKVFEAEALGYDTLPAFKGELNSYRSQLSKPYMTDHQLEERLYKEAYSHLLEDVEVSHILIRLPQKPTPGDTLMAYKRAYQAYNRLKKEPFEVVAQQMSDDQSVSKNQGYLGFFTGLMAVWPIEKAMYDLKVGEVSAPIRTNYGYHIVKVHSRRPARGQVNAKHILKLANDQMSPAEQDKAYRDIISISNKLDQGEEFENLARQYSDDKGSASRGGDLSWFGIGRMVTEFEDAAFGLEVGEVSKPVKTQFGWHLIKVYGKRGIDSFENKRSEIRRAMQYDERSDAAKLSFVNGLKDQYSFKLNDKSVLELKKFLKDNSVHDSLLVEKSKVLIGDIFTFEGHRVSSQDFIRFYLLTGGSDDIDNRIDQLAEMELMRYEESRLEQKYPDFALLMQEYHDGILLFDISNREVWDKANRDTEGLTAYFQEHREVYNWSEPRYKGTIVRCSDKATAKVVKALLKHAPSDSIESYLVKRVNIDSIDHVKVEYGLWQEGDNGIIDSKIFKIKSVTMPVSDAYPIIIVSGKLLKKGPESYKDVRGVVTSDYQNYLEKTWVESLESKYKVIIYEDVLNSMVKP